LPQIPIISERPTDTNRCGGQAPGYLDIATNPLFGVEAPADACFVKDGNQNTPCDQKILSNPVGGPANQITVTNCGGFFVYKLVNTPPGPGGAGAVGVDKACSLRYCLDAEPDVLTVG
jgi:hypothetical protein